MTKFDEAYANLVYCFLNIIDLPEVKRDRDLEETIVQVWQLLVVAANKNGISFDGSTIMYDIAAKSKLNDSPVECLELFPAYASQLCSLLPVDPESYELSGFVLPRLKPVSAIGREAMIREGGIIRFGSLDWRVIEEANGKMLLLSDKILEKRAWSSKLRGRIKHLNKWASSPLREYLNGAFLSRSFSQQERSALVETADAGKVFCLSSEEATLYFPDGVHRQCGVASTDSWWLRSTDAEGYVEYVVGHGRITATIDSSLNLGVRPACWIMAI